MAGETKIVRGTQKTLSTTIAAIANNAMSAAIGTYDATDTLDYPDAEFALKVTFGTAPLEMSSLDLCVRPLDIQGTNDAEVPDAGFQPHKIGSFSLNNVTSAQWLFCRAYDLPKSGEFYLFNSATGQSTVANAELYMTPLSYAPA